MATKLKQIEQVRHNQGGLKSSKHYGVVCRNCNNGWMSRIEMRTKPILTALIDSHEAQLTLSDQATLAEWIVLKGIVVEHSRAEQITTNKADIIEFYNNMTIPNKTNIYIFKCGEFAMRTFYSQYNMSLFRNPSTIFRKTIKDLAIGIGDLFVYLSFVDPVAPDINYNVNHPGAIRLWPPAHDIIVWPPVISISECDAREIAQGLERFSKTLGRWGV